MVIQVTDVRCEKGDAAFLLDDGVTTILYDTGFGFTGDRVAENIALALGDRKLDYIFLTHSHYDHVLGCPYVLKRYPDAKVVAGSIAAGIFERDGAKRVMKDLDGKFAAACGVDSYEYLGDQLKVDITVEDGDRVQAGDMEFEVIHLPGHTRCCMGFYCASEKLLLSNETLGVYDGDKTIIPIYLVSYADTLASIEKVKHLDITSILVPHYGVLNAEQTAYFLQNMRTAAENIAKRVMDSVQQGMSDEQIVEAFKDTYWNGYIQEIYPEDAITLNTSIMVRLIKQELLKGSVK